MFERNRSLLVTKNDQFLYVNFRLVYKPFSVHERLYTLFGKMSLCVPISL